MVIGVWGIEGGPEGLGIHCPNLSGDCNFIEVWPGSIGSQLPGGCSVCTEQVPKLMLRVGCRVSEERTAVKDVSVVGTHGTDLRTLGGLRRTSTSSCGTVWS
jgi:hypothetical protein